MKATVFRRIYAEVRDQLHGASLPAMGMYLHLRTTPDACRIGLCWVRVQALAARFERSPRQVRALLAELQIRGLLVWDPVTELGYCVGHALVHGPAQPDRRLAWAIAASRFPAGKPRDVLMAELDQVLTRSRNPSPRGNVAA